MKELSTEEISVTAAGSPVKELSVEEKIKAIQNTRCYKDMVNDWFPPYREKEYYFVSYSHQDYKLVYESLHRLQNGKQKLNLWYDHDLTPGRDWEKEARRYIYDYDCKGVIFFLSENAVLSDSIHKEIEFVKASGKEYLSINLPCEMIKGYEGEYLSAEKMLTLLKEQYGNDPAYVDRFSDYDNKLDVLAKTFNDKVIFLHLNDKIDNQIEGILSLKRQPLLVIDKDGVVTAINDINAEEITKEDFIHEYKDGKPVFAQRIGDCAFANCSLLRKVDLPKECVDLGRYSFYNCKSLREIKLPLRFHKWFFLNSLSDGVFQGCTSLESITIPDDEVRSIGDEAFRACTSLRSVIFGSNSKLTSIGKLAFWDCKSLESITIPDEVRSIGDEAFYYCTSLESVTIPDNVESIGNYAFSYCTSLKSITIHDKVTSIGKFAFSGLTSLEIVIFGGTKQQWINIDKGVGWDAGTLNYVVHCTDGDLKKGEF